MATNRRTLTRTEESMEFYKTQPVSYRRLWWEWASREPNFREMVQWARAHEKDEGVLRVMEGWSGQHGN